MSHPSLRLRMHRRRHAAALIAGLLCMCWTANAAAPSTASATASAAATPPARAGSAPQALDARAAVPLAPLPTALQHWRRIAPAPAGDWRAANERVERIGGWRAYAREAASAASGAQP